MTTVLNAFENGLADETTLTAPTSGYAGADDLSDVHAEGTGASAKVDTQIKYTDTRSLKLTLPKTTAGDRRRVWVDHAPLFSATLIADCLFYVPRVDPQPQQIIMQGIDPDGFDRWGVLLDNDGRLRMRTFTNGNASGGRTSSSIQYDTWFRVAVFSSIHATTQASNILTLRYYADPAGAVSQEIANNGANLGAQGETFAMARAGRINPSAAAAMTMYIDYFRADSVDWLGSPVVTAPQGWQWVEQEPYGAGGFNGIFQSLIDPLTFYSISDVGGMRVSRDGGETWHLSTRGAYLAENHKKTAGYGIALNPEDLSKEIIAVGCGFNGADPAIIASYDGGDTWVHKSTQVGFNSQSPNDTHSPPLPKNPRSIQKLIDIDPIAGPNGKGYWYAASFAKGIYRSVDGGTNWTLISMPQVGSITDAWYPRYLTLYPGDGNKLIVGVYDAYGHQGLFRLDGVRSSTNISPVRLSPVAGETGGGGGSADFNLKQLPEITPGVQSTLGAALATPSYPERHQNYWYIVGSFDQAIDVDGTVYNRPYVMRFLATAPYSMDTSWNPAPNDEVYDTALSKDGTKLYVVGNFTTFEGVTRNRIAEVDLVTMNVTSKFSGMSCNGAIRCITIDHNGDIWVGGGFTSIGGLTRTRLAKLDGTTGAVTGVNVACVANWVQDLDFDADSARQRVLVYLRNDGTVGGGATCKLASIQTDGTVVWRANPNVGTFTFQISIEVGLTTSSTVSCATNGDNRTFCYDLSSGTQKFWWHSDGNNQGVTTFRKHMIVGHHGAFTEVNPNVGSGDAGTDATSGGLYSIDITQAATLSGGLDAWRPSFNSTLRAHRIGSDAVSGQVCVTGDFTTVSQGGTTVNRARVALFETQAGGGGGTTLPLVNSVEECVFDDDGIMYAVCATDGVWRVTPPYTPDQWVDLDPTEAFISKSSHWNAIAVSDKGASTTIEVGCHNPVRVSATGVPGGSLNKYGCAYRISNAQATPTITYVTDPGTSGFPGGGDQDVNVNDISTGKRFWRADDGADNILGRSASSVAAIVNDRSNKNRWINQGGAGINWISEDDGLTWQAAATGMVIGSTMSVTADPLRQGWFLSGNQDHDAFYTDNGGDDWQRTPNVADFTIGFNGYCHSNGYWYLCEGDDDSATGRILRWDGSGTAPTWTTIAGAAAGGTSGTTNSVPTNRGLAAVAGIASDLTTLREVIWMENSGIWTRDGGTGAWTQATGFPLQTEDTNTRSAGHSLIWPNPGSAYLWAVVRSGSSPGLYRSANRGSTWTNRYPMSAMGRCEGYVVGNSVSNHTLFLTGSGGSLIRVENAAGTETFRTITSFVGPRAVALEPAGRLLVWTMPTATALAHLWAVDSPNGTGATMSAVDLFDPATEASDEQGQHVGWNVKSLASNGQQIMMAVNGASVARGILT